MRAWASEMSHVTADVVVLQEVWHAAAQEVAGQVLRAHGFQHMVRFGGLVLASKHPIEAHGHSQFPTCGIPTRIADGDFIVQKGVLHARLQLPSGAPVTVATTHNLAFYEDGMAVNGAWAKALREAGAAAVTTLQGLAAAPTAWWFEHDVNSGHRAAQAVHMVETLGAAAGNGPLVFAGDFNMVPGCTALQATVQALGGELLGRNTHVRPAEACLAPALAGSAGAPPRQQDPRTWPVEEWAATFDVRPSPFCLQRQLTGVPVEQQQLGVVPERLDHVIGRGVRHVATHRLFDRLFAVDGTGQVQGAPVCADLPPDFAAATSPPSQAEYTSPCSIHGAFTSWATAESWTGAKVQLEAATQAALGQAPDGTTYITPSDHTGLCTEVVVQALGASAASSPGLWGRLTGDVRGAFLQQLEDGVTGASERGDGHLLLASVYALGMLGISHRMRGMRTAAQVGLPTAAPAPAEVPLPRRTPRRGVPASVPQAPGAAPTARPTWGPFKHTLPSGERVVVASPWLRRLGWAGFAALGVGGAIHGGLYWHARWVERPALEAAAAAVRAGGGQP